MARRRLPIRIIPILELNREGIQPFQVARLGLVAELDALLRRFSEDAEFPSMVLGGQTIILHDYLELRAHSESLIESLVRAGRIEIGPWYVLPDILLVSPESLIRNLRLGRESANRFGRCLSVAYLRAGASELSQMPQILSGFGMTSAVIPHNEQFAVPQVCALQGSDGTDLALMIPPVVITDINRSVEPADFQFNSDSEVDGPNMCFFSLRDRAVRTLDEASQSLGSMADWSTLIECGEAAQSLKLKPKLKQFGLVAHSHSSFSARIWIKQNNNDAQILLERWVEPYSVWAKMIGETGGSKSSENLKLAPLIDYAWRILLENHASSVMSGNHIDDVDRDITIRFNHVSQISETLLNHTWSTIEQNVDTSCLDPYQVWQPLIVYNAAPITQRAAVDIGIALPEHVHDIEIVDSNGTIVPHQIEQSGDETTRPGQNISVRFLPQHIPSIGYSTFGIRSSSQHSPRTIVDEGTLIENQFLSVSVIGDDGTLALFDKRTGRSFAGLNHYVDGGDSGNISGYQAPVVDTIIDIATNTPLHVERRVGPVSQILHLLQIFRVPHGLSEGRDTRMPLAAQFVPLSVWTTIRLTNDVPRVDIEAHISNTAKNHRLQAHFPTGIHQGIVYLDSHFGVESHEVGPNTKSVFAQRQFVTVIGDSSGLTIANRGLPEVEIISDQTGSDIALTLLRAVEDLIPGEYVTDQVLPTFEAQCIGEHHMMYSIIPHSSDALPAWEQAYLFQTPPIATYAGLHAGILPQSASLVTSDNPRFIISAVYESGIQQGLIVRGYNIGGETERVTLRFGVAVKRAQQVRLDETPMAKSYKVRSSGINVTVAAHEIVTLHVI
jgi:alpha-mannosidase